ncbi:MAG: glycine dehydrogenase (aminomethyl-transferring) [Nitrospiraceae bacterium]|nr:glycine dehydrogenase (aminomethyl-transferring) [Nitrospiraceae bacterium]
MIEPTIFELSREGRPGYLLPPLDVPDTPVEELLDPKVIRTPLHLPEVSEFQIVRHFTRLSQATFGIDQGFYPLGSCTMKYNPKINDEIANLPGFAHLHPLQSPGQSQGVLQLIYDLEELLKEIAGLDRISLQPTAGAQAEFAAMLMVRSYHQQQSGNTRTKVLIPDSAHGTNPASAILAGYKIEVVKSGPDGLVDINDLKRLVDTDCAALMLTNPNTLGLFEREIVKISEIVHAAGVQLYLDGANLNALVGMAKPGDMGFDVVHFNLHKTFSTPHGGGGPGAGALGVKSHLEPYLPAPTVERQDNRYILDTDRPQSIGRVATFYGNIGILVRAFTYISRLGHTGLRAVSRLAIVNANYIRKRLENHYHIPYNRPCLHECVVSAKDFKSNGVHAWDIAKRLLDYEFYAPTVNFPLIVEEALMIEPTETEPKASLDAFCDAMIAIANEASSAPDLVKNAPHTLAVSRIDEVTAIRQLDLREAP